MFYCSANIIIFNCISWLITFYISEKIYADIYKYIKFILNLYIKIICVYQRERKEER